jgi:hypothetical protein
MGSKILRLFGLSHFYYFPHGTQCVGDGIGTAKFIIELS